MSSSVGMSRWSSSWRLPMDYRWMKTVVVEWLGWPSQQARHCSVFAAAASAPCAAFPIAHDPDKHSTVRPKCGALNLY